jgi:redox-sensitive bicupin YhaK (pirin superfamily)
MIKIRRADDRGHADHGWLNAYHSFSFAEYFDPEHMGFRSLRVINEDRVQPSQGFGTHGHRDMEIVTYILEGSLEHKDSMGNGSVIKAGEVQYMSAGKGVQHSEFNSSPTELVHLLQIWILPDKKGYEPRYAQKLYSAADKKDRLKLIVSPDGADGSISIRQDARIFASILSGGTSVTHQFMPGRFGWLQVTSGQVSANGKTLWPGDGAAISEESKLEIKNLSDKSELLLFDLS